nr:phosphomevalonate kinase [Pardosa pseudoannulata]
MLPNDDQNFGSPKAIIILSGKRKSGKDFIANLLLERFLPEEAVIVRLSGPLKERYALENDLDYKRLLDTSEYKEVYRQKMIKWGEEIRNHDPGYFCRHAIAQSNASYKKIWVVSDARRKTDIEFFLSNFPNITHTVRINASDDVRKNRGWIYTKGVDDVESECGLDDYANWSFQLTNNNTKELLEQINSFLQAFKLN